jgi:hypothetical protein
MAVVSSAIQIPTARRSTIAPGNMNRLQMQDRSVHDWYRFVLSFPPHLVQQYLEKFKVDESGLVLDPFCGTGTTLVECKKLGIPSIGVEANPMAHFASTVKTTWDTSAKALLQTAELIADVVRANLESDGTPDDLPLPLFNGKNQRSRIKLRSLPHNRKKLLLRDSISELPLHKTLRLIEEIDKTSAPSEAPFFRLALASALVQSIGNLHFGPEVGVGPPKVDVAVVAQWLDRVGAMARDLQQMQLAGCTTASCVLKADARSLSGLAGTLGNDRVSAVITSPPYPNEKDYTRTTRLESVLLGFISDKAELQRFKRTLMRSNTRNVYKGDEDDRWVAAFPSIQRIVAEIESRRMELGKTSGFEKMYGRVTALYFGGMARHFSELRPFLRPGANLAYVLGDQASFFRVLIRTGTILAEVAESLGYEIIGLDLFRTRLATATRQQLREEVLVLRWNGSAAT